jgi:hypothetical protein
VVGLTHVFILIQHLQAAVAQVWRYNASRIVPQLLVLLSHFLYMVHHNFAEQLRMSLIQVAV